MYDTIILSDNTIVYIGHDISDDDFNKYPNLIHISNSDKILNEFTVGLYPTITLTQICNYLKSIGKM